MDTVEELNSTYFYAGRSNLTASQLLFMIFCENTANQLGVQDFGAIVSIVAGLNVLPTRTKPRGAIEGTSLASRGSRKVFGIAKRRLGIFLHRSRLPSRSSSSIFLCASFRTAPRRLLSTICPWSTHSSLSNT